MIENWQGAILGYSEECLTPHMKILILKWDEIKRAMRRKGQVDEHGFIWVTVGYFSACCGCTHRTMQRTLDQMSKAGYIKKVYQNKGTQAQSMGVRMNECVYDAHFEPLLFRNKSYRQKKFFCLDCGSRNVDIQPEIYRVLCKDCGSFHYQNSKGKSAMKPRKEVE